MPLPAVPTLAPEVDALLLAFSDGAHGLLAASPELCAALFGDTPGTVEYVPTRDGLWVATTTATSTTATATTTAVTTN